MLRGHSELSHMAAWQLTDLGPYPLVIVCYPRRTIHQPRQYLLPGAEERRSKSTEEAGFGEDKLPDVESEFGMPNADNRQLTSSTHLVCPNHGEDYAVVFDNNRDYSGRDN